MNEQANNHHQQHVPAKKFALPQSYTDFDFNIDFDTAFSNIPIDIPSSTLLSELLNGPQNVPVNPISSLSSSVPSVTPQLVNQHDPNHARIISSSPQQLPAPQFNNQPIPSSLPVLPSTTPATTSLATSTLLAPSLDSAASNNLQSLFPVTAKQDPSAEPLFNAQESSMISQFFEKFNADPEFIFSPKLDSRLLNLTEHDFSTPPAFQTHQQNNGTKNLLNNNNNNHQTHVNSWDIPTPDIFPFVSNTNPIPAPVHPINNINNNTTNALSNPPNLITKLPSHTAISMPHNEPLQRPNPDALRKLPIKYGTDPSFQEGGFQPSYSLSSSIRTRKVSNNAPESPGFDINNFSNDPIKFENIYNSVNHNNNNNNNDDAAAAITTKKSKKKSSAAAISASIVASTRRKSAEASGRPRRENLTEDQKRMNHISSEKRRRDLIKTQFTEMCSLVPKLANSQSAAASSSSKSTVLQIVYDYIVLMFEQNKQLRQFLTENHIDLTGIADSTIPRKSKELAPPEPSQ